MRRSKYRGSCYRGDPIGYWVPMRGTVGRAWAEVAVRIRQLGRAIRAAR